MSYAALTERMRQTSARLDALKYSPDQPRDDQGRFAYVGGAAGGENDLDRVDPSEPYWERAARFGKVTEAIATKAGFKVMPWLDLPQEVRDQLTVEHLIQEPSFNKNTVAMANGVVAGRSDIEKANIPGLTSELNNYRLVFADYAYEPSQSISMTTITNPDDPSMKYLLVNTRMNVERAVAVIDETTFGAHASELSKIWNAQGQGKATEEMFRQSMAHEAGHVFENLRPGSTENFVQELTGVFGKTPDTVDEQTEREISNWLKENISGYAVRGGASEAMADAFERLVHNTLPKELDGWKRHVYGK
jgi:hypothetical protein